MLYNGQIFIGHRTKLSRAISNVSCAMKEEKELLSSMLHKDQISNVRNKNFFLDMKVLFWIKVFRLNHYFVIKFDACQTNGKFQFDLSAGPFRVKIFMLEVEHILVSRSR